MDDIVQKNRTIDRKSARYLVERALKIMGYPFSVEERQDGSCRVNLAYQGADFFIFIDNSDYVRLQMIDGTYCMAEDVEEFSRLKRSVNEANWKSSVTIVYTILEDSQEVLLNFSSFALAIPQIPLFDNYLETELDQFFFAQEKVWLEMSKMKRLENQLREELLLSPDEYDNKRIEIMKQKDETQDLFLETLDEMGCPYKIDEEINCILLNYKKVGFIAHVQYETSEILLACRGWESVDLNDIDEVMRMKQAVNVANEKGFVMTAYENDYDRHELLVSSKKVIYFCSHIKDRKNYLRAKLDDFIDVQQIIEIEMEELRKDK